MRYYFLPISLEHLLHGRHCARKAEGGGVRSLEGNTPRTVYAEVLDNGRFHQHHAFSHLSVSKHFSLSGFCSASLLDILKNPIDFYWILLRNLFFQVHVLFLQTMPLLPPLSGIVPCSYLSHYINYMVLIIC